MVRKPEERDVPKGRRDHETPAECCAARQWVPPGRGVLSSIRNPLLRCVISIWRALLQKDQEIFDLKAKLAQKEAEEAKREEEEKKRREDLAKEEEEKKREKRSTSR